MRFLSLIGVLAGSLQAAEPLSISGIYPHLAYSNNEGECGTGAVVPWAGKLWVITYGPHLPKGSSDKLYEIDDALGMTIRPESVGGTPAARMIHKESDQLFIGPYAIGRDRFVRTIQPKAMPGRLTGLARHLTDPAGKVYYATMEEGFYEVDVKTLEVKPLYADANSMKNHAGELLPGYHGKGLYSGQGRLVYANNGELSPEAQRKPDIPSGCLAEWNGKDWNVVRRNQFTDLTGPGGLFGNANPEKDPLWSIGWDHRSLILMILDGGKWHSYRLPKASHSYDGAHGWNTEWPRIRDIGENELLMTMHGAFWKFPRTMSVANSAGIAPRSNYLKVVGDFAAWNGKVVLGCDDAAKSEFLNKRKAKGSVAAPGRSHSNLWFVDAKQLDSFGPAIGRGGVWMNDAVKANTPSDPYLFGGFTRRAALLSHDVKGPVTFTFEIDLKGNGTWNRIQEVEVKGPKWVEFPPNATGEWIRVSVNRECGRATAVFTGSNSDLRTAKPSTDFDGLAALDADAYSGGIVRARGDKELNLSFAASLVKDGKATEAGYYEMGADLKLKKVDNKTDHEWLKANCPVPAGVLLADEASVLTIDDAGRRWRMPLGGESYSKVGPVPLRVCREVCTERDLFHAQGHFYELPAENAGGFAKMRPVASHPFRITDYCSWRGLLVLSGVAADAKPDNPHIRRSDDGRVAVWVGAVDDLWKLGKPTGKGGPWKDSAVKAGVPSDPYLFNGYDKKSIELSHNAGKDVSFQVEVDITGTGDWKPYLSFAVPSGKPLKHEFPAAFQAYWVRVVPGADCTATAVLQYE
jgi:hypothetical protein